MPSLFYLIQGRV